MNPELTQQLIILNQRVAQLEEQLNLFVRPARYSFSRTVEFLNRVQFLNYIGFFGKTPIAQASAIAAPAGGGSGLSDAIDISGRAAINSLRTALKNIGITA